MVDFPTAVQPPGAASYSAPLLSFSNFSNWAADDPYKKTFDEQQKQLNQQKLQQGQQQLDLQQAFQGGIPRDAQGNPDYQKIAAVLAQKGDIGALTQLAPLIQQSQAASTPLYGGMPGAGGGAAPQQDGGPQGGAQPASVPARPLPPSGPGPQGDSGTGSVTSLVTDRLPAQNLTTGQTILKIAQVMGIDPNADLTPGQQRRAQGLLDRYAPDIAGPASGGGNMPPSANAGTPRPPVVAAGDGGGRTGAPGGAVSGAPVTAQQGAAAQGGPQPGPQGSPQGAPGAAGGQPITPQVPLPPGFTDPMQAINALRDRAAKLEAANPRTKPIADRLNAQADAIEKSLQPLSVGAQSTLVDPRTGKPLYQGPAAAQLAATTGAEGSPTLDADAEAYRQTGKLPPGMGRGIQGNAEAKAIRNRATDLETAAGGNPAEWPQKWQQFKSQQVAVQRFGSGKEAGTVRSFNVLVDHLDTLSEAASALKNGDMRILNRWSQNWAAQTGQTAPTNFDGVKALVGDEIVKAVVGSAGALADREEVKKDLDRASSPKQLAELVERYKKLALGQLKGLRKEFTTSTGLAEKDFDAKLLPNTLSALSGKSEGGSSGAAKMQGKTSSGLSWSVE